MGHFLFAKWALGLLEEMRGDKAGRGRYLMGDWVRMNVVRTMSVDTAGWMCYLIAVLKAIQV